MTELSPLNSKPITECQICGNQDLTSELFLGHVPSVNSMPDIHSAPTIELRFPLELKNCEQCKLVQIGYDVDQRILFPHSYPYLSGSTKILRDNFNQLADEVAGVIDLKSTDLVIDIGANDGTLLTPFKKAGYRVLGIEPSQAADVARANGIEMMKAYFNKQTAFDAVKKYGKAKVVTAANVFAHMTNTHEIVDGIKDLLDNNGLFISENHYLIALIDTLQYDTIYHEHLRYYSVTSLVHLFKQHDMEVIRVKRIPTHGGSVRVYAARKGQFPIDASVAEILKAEDHAGINNGNLLKNFKKRVANSKIELLQLLAELKKEGHRIYGIGAPSRASTLINYVGINEDLVDCVMEISTSHKINKFIPGTRVPVLDEKKLYEDQPEYALLYSWHIADELAHNLRKRGYRGKFIVPLPEPRIIDGE